MTSNSSSFRSWWQPPRKTIDREEDRSVTFLELFYDLVYVVLVAELAHGLATNVTLAGVAGFAFLFIIVWWAWINGTLYHELHGNNDVRTRVFTFLQMFTVAAMAVFAHNALGEGSIGFALSYTAFQLILTYLWWRTGVHDPEHRPLSTPYVLAFLFNTLLFIISVFVPPPWRFVLWGIALVISLLLPLNTLRMGRKNPEVREELDRSSYTRRRRPTSPELDRRHNGRSGHVDRHWPVVDLLRLHLRTPAAVWSHQHETLALSTSAADTEHHGRRSGRLQSRRTQQRTAFRRGALAVGGIDCPGPRLHRFAHADHPGSRRSLSILSPRRDRHIRIGDADSAPGFNQPAGHPFADCHGRAFTRTASLWCGSLDQGLWGARDNDQRR